MTLRPPQYRPRLLDPVISRLLASVGAVSVEGPRWCGKTWASLNQAESAFFVADPAGGFRNREVAQLDPSAVLDGASPRVIDEWQEAPGLWDAVRFTVDQRPGKGHFILTGSSTPADDAVIHSGAGRIARIRMRPMTLPESGDAKTQVSLSDLLTGEKPIPTAMGTFTLTQIADLVVRGGWPGTLSLGPDQAAQVLETYLEASARTDISTIDTSRRDPAKMTALIRSLARNTATTATQATLRRDMANHFDATLSETTLRHYLAILHRLYLIEEIPAWEPALRSPIRLRQSPKRILADPSLAAVALSATPEHLIAEPKTLGFLFENLVLRDLLVYAHVLGGSLHHYRDSTDLEADAILTLPQGDWAAFEIKLGHPQIDNAAATLLRLAEKITAAGHRPPRALAVIVGTGAFSHVRDDGVTVIPIDALGN
ncbi:MAG: DUF4143 domain-containing protein [Propionibacteriaceae bacterium]|jgi:predicted AAA+ superfamily ATPase|nr:DUF4143 domain-containing protein [Propionibacteriaceae bacterium]